MSFLLKNGTLVTPGGVLTGDVLLRGERIAAIGSHLPCPLGTEVLDCTGKLVLPGCIDTHTHFEMNKGLPNETADDWASGTLSALCGGTTTVLDFAEPERGASLQSALDTWHSRAEGHASCNYGFHMTIKDWNEAIRAELPAMAKQGVSSYKIYLAYQLRVSDAVAYEAVKAVSALGGVTGCHCENGELVELGVKEQKARGNLGPRAHPAARPPAVEAEAVCRYLAIAERAGGAVNVVHLSTKRGLELARAARDRGQPVYLETCPQYLLLDDSVYDLPGFESAKYVFSPPARSREDVEALWEAVADGSIDTVGTDHCSFTTEVKALGREDFSGIPNGMPGVEDRLRLLYTYGVAAGRIGLERLVELLSANPARLFGMWPLRGALAVDSIADIVIYDPNITERISTKTNHSACDYDPYEGMEVRGRVDTVLLGGEVAVSEGKPVRTGLGRFVHRGGAQFWR